MPCVHVLDSTVLAAFGAIRLRQSAWIARFLFWSDDNSTWDRGDHCCVANGDLIRMSLNNDAFDDVSSLRFVWLASKRRCRPLIVSCWLTSRRYLVRHGPPSPMQVRNALLSHISSLWNRLFLTTWFSPVSPPQKSLNLTECAIHEVDAPGL